MTYPSVYPTGATVYNPQKCWNGYTLYQVFGKGALLIDMNGKEVKLWQHLHGFPNKLLPGGQVLGSTAERSNAAGFQDSVDVAQIDWAGNIVWKFNQYEYIEDPGQEPCWMARQHHDYQRAGNPVGYYVPGMDPLVERGNTIILSHRNVKNPKITDKELLDDVIYEVTWDGKIVWEWVCSEHFDDLGFTEEAKNTLYRFPNVRFLESGGASNSDAGLGDWMHINSMSVLGPNKWYDAGDERFHPDNILWDARETNILAIIDKKTGKIVWKVGPDYNTGDALKKLGWIIGQHHVHMIPRGLPGEGNILIFDNGGWAGYGIPNPGAPTGFHNAIRDYSRVLEIDPVTLAVKWQYTPIEAGLAHPIHSGRFYSPIISGAQRLPNGNTLITEGTGGRLIEVTPGHELVWEYINPYEHIGTLNMVYRAYRYPYDWVPQLAKPVEKPIERLNVAEFRVPNSALLGCDNVTEVQGAQEYQEQKNNLCVATVDEI